MRIDEENTNPIVFEKEFLKVVFSHIHSIDVIILQDYNKYLIFLEKYFSDKKAKPLKQGKELVKQIFG